MGRQRRAWLVGGDGIRADKGQARTKFYVRFNEYPEPGQRVSRSRAFSKQADAKRFVAQYNAKSALHLLPGERPRVGFREALGEFLAGVSTLARATREHYAATLGHFTRIVGERPRVDEYRGADVDQFCLCRIRDGIAHATVAKDVRALRRFFRWGNKRRYLDFNPVEDATAIPKGRFARARPPLTNESVAAIVKQIGDEDRRIAVWLAATTGLDRGMIARLTAASVDFEAGLIRVVRRKTRAHGRVLAIPLHPSLVGPLRDRASRVDDGAPLLCGVLRRGRGRDWFSWAVADAGLRGVIFRDLRAMAVQRGLGAGVSLAALSKMLGHSSLEVTVGHYVLPDADAARRLGELALPGQSPTSATPPA